MFSKINSIGVSGVEGYRIQVEVDVSDGLPGYSLVGYLSSEVKEAQDRVRTALKNSGYQLQPKKITVNLSPADVRKAGTAFDLPISMAVLSAYGIICGNELREAAAVGELSLNGNVKPVSGTMVMAAAAKKTGFHQIFVPWENRMEASVIPGIQVIGVQNIREFVDCFNHMETDREGISSINSGTSLNNRFLMAKLSVNPAAPALNNPANGDSSVPSFPYAAPDFRDINGQMLVRRATEVATAGMHNILYIGPAGAGKTMAAQRIPTILPPLTAEETVDVSKIYSICGLLSEERPLVQSRPFRNPHHTISPQALTGGGLIPKPGEISLASKGVLFLDELTEFKKNTLEILRQPLEDRKIVISRVYGSYTFPADFLFAAAMNPCSCGFYPDRTKCRCSETQVRQYLGRISKPLLDRIDICAEAVPIQYKDMKGSGGGENSVAIRARVMKAHDIQRKRLEGSGCSYNSAMGVSEIKKFCVLKEEEDQFLQKVYESMGLSARAYGKILKVARTIADLDGGGPIKKIHLAEAVSYRGLEEKYWGGNHDF